MNSIIKNNSEIKKIIISSKIVKDILNYVSKYIKEGISTGEINDICHDRIINYHKAYPASLGYMNYPKSICTSINDTVCHGIPNYNIILKKGDIINIDVSVCKNNYYSDSSKMFFINPINYSAYKLCNVTYRSILNSLKYIKNGNNLNLIGYSIDNYIKKYGYSIVKEYCGHGIGKKLHEFPNILHYKNNCNILMRSGMVFTIEPMVNIGSNKIYITKDK